MADSKSAIEQFSILGYLITSLETDQSKRDNLQGLIDEQVTEFQNAANSSSDDAARYQAALAKGLPAVTTGIVAAVQGFQKGDPFAGSSEVIGVVSNLITSISSISVAAGPPGALVGAILSVFSIILKAFSEQKPAKSIEKKLEEVINNYDSENNIKELKSAQNRLNRDIEILTGYGIEKLKYSSSDIETTLSTTDKRQRLEDARVWIKKPRSQELELWGAVVAAQCFAYISFVQALTLAMIAADTTKDKRHFTDILRVSNEAQKTFLDDIMAAVRNRGTLYALRAPANISAGRFYSSAVHKRDAVVSNVEWQGLSQGNSPNVMLLTVSNRYAKNNGGFAHPAKALFTVQNSYRMIGSEWEYNPQKVPNHPFRKTLITRNPGGESQRTGRYALSQIDEKSEVHGLVPSGDAYDMWATPGIYAGEINVFTAEGRFIFFYTQGGPIHRDNELKLLTFRSVFTMPEGYKAGAVRAVAPRPFEDEDRSLLYPEDVKDLQVVYGACEVAHRKSVVHPTLGEHMELSVNYLTASGTGPYQFRSFFMWPPWNDFIGIGADSRYLWVYKAGEIACITHTEVFAHVNQKKTFEWMKYKIPEDAGITSYDPNKPRMEGRRQFPTGLIDLSPCDDGTLTAVFMDKERYGVGKGGPIYTMAPVIDRKSRSLRITGLKGDLGDHTLQTSGWATDKSMYAYRVVKEPITCWPLIEGLRETLSSNPASE